MNCLLKGTALTLRFVVAKWAEVHSIQRQLPCELPSRHYEATQQKGSKATPHSNGNGVQPLPLDDEMQQLPVLLPRAAVTATSDLLSQQPLLYESVY